MKKNLLLNGMAFLMCLFLFAGVSAQTTKTFLVTKDSTWTIPTKADDGVTPLQVTSVTFEGIGAGGAGGYMPWGLTRRGGGGGGGGAYATVTVDNPTGSYQIIPGVGGTNPLNGPTVSGSASVVKQSGTTILSAAGGASSPYVSRDGGKGAKGGQASACIPTTGAYSGGDGADPYGLLLGWLISYSGGGGGAANSGSVGGNASNGEDVVGGAAGTGDMPAGKGGNGRSAQSGDGAGGESYGAGGSGATAYTTISSGSGNDGGAGANGVVRVTYTYISETIEVADAEVTICHDSLIDLPLDITVSGFELKDAHISYGGSTPPAGLSYGVMIQFNTTDNKWHLTGHASNTNSTTQSFTISGTASTKNYVGNDNYTITVNVYGQLDGGVIAEDQLVCHDVNIQYLTSVQDATGGSGDFYYKWMHWDNIDVTAGNITSGSQYWMNIPNSNATTYLPELQGQHFYARGYVDAHCGTVFALAEQDPTRDFLEVTTVDPLTFTDSYSSNDTICLNETYHNEITMEFNSPIGYANDWYHNYNWNIYWQKSTDKGAHWDNLTGLVWATYIVDLTPSDYSAQGNDDFWYRAALKFNDCDSVPLNAIYKVHVKENPDYTAQFQDVNITLWYGACDTNIANLAAPTLDPTPASVTRADSYTTVDTGTHIIKWNVIADNCNIPVEYEQKVIVAYPACNTKVADANGHEYEVVRVGCDCWIAENLRTNSTDGVYYDEDAANEAFGKLYNWNDAVAVNNTEKTAKTGNKYLQGMCPDGWAIPTSAQFNTMLAAAGGDAQAVKSNDESTWLPGEAGTNTSGFGAKGAGYYEANQYQRMLGYTYFWTSELNSTNSYVAKTMELRCGCGEFTCVDKSKENKVSVRCVRIEPAE